MRVQERLCSDIYPLFPLYHPFPEDWKQSSPPCGSTCALCVVAAAFAVEPSLGNAGSSFTGRDTGKHGEIRGITLGRRRDKQTQPTGTIWLGTKYHVSQFCLLTYNMGMPSNSPMSVAWERTSSTSVVHAGAPGRACFLWATARTESLAYSEGQSSRERILYPHPGGRITSFPLNLDKNVSFLLVTLSGNYFIFLGSYSWLKMHISNTSCHKIQAGFYLGYLG